MSDNPFDQFDAAPANSFDQFDAPAQVTPAAPAEAPFSFGSWLKSNVGVPLARAGVNAVSALPLMAEDFGVGIRNVASDIQDNGIGAAASKFIHGGQYPYELPSHIVQGAMQPYLPAPTSLGGKLSEVANSVLMAGGAGMSGVPGLTAPTYGNVPSAFVSAKQAARGGQFQAQLPDSLLAPTSGLTAAQEQAATAGQKLGMQLTPGQATGSVALQQLEAKLQAQPWTSGPFNKIRGNNQSVLNSSWAGPSGGIGESGASLDSTVLARAADRTGEIFNGARNANSIIAQDPAVTSNLLNGIDTEFEGLIPGSIRDNPLVSRFESLTQSGAINGEQLGSLSSKLGRAASNQMTGMGGDREMGQALFAVKDHVDDLLQSTLSGAEASQYAAARGQYRALMQLTARTGNVNPSSGNVGGVSIANYLQAKDKGGFLFGRNQSDAYNAARFAQAFKPIVGDSGTATRSWSMAELPFALPANLLSRAYLSSPGSAAARMFATPLNIPRGTLPYYGLPALQNGYSDDQ